MEIMRKRLANLLSVKSIVTIILTGVFAFMGKISQDFMTIYAVVIAFYFGTQSQKVQDAVDQQTGDSHE